MRYLVKARVKSGKEKALRDARADGTLGQGARAGDEYLYDMQQARVGEEGVASRVATCFCAPPLEAERACWEKYFGRLSVRDAHNRKNCRHENGAEPWACGNCDCPQPLEQRWREKGGPLLTTLQRP